MKPHAVGPSQGESPGSKPTYQELLDQVAQLEKLRHLASFPARNPNPVAEADLGGHLLYLNPAGERLFPDLRENGPAHPWLAGWEAVVRTIRASEAQTLSRTVVVGERHYQQTLQYLADSGSIRIYAVDVSARARAEDALRESERLYRAIAETIDYGVWVCAPDGRNVYASESFLKLVGITQQQCSDFGWGDVLHPDDAERTIAAWKDCVRTGGTWSMEHRVRGLDGQWHPILARGVPVKDDSGKVVCWAGINLDISEQKRAEEALLDADRRKDEFLAVLSHELRNPLTPIRNSLGVLERTAPGSEPARRALEIIGRQTGHLARLVDDLLDVTRITRNRIELQRGPLELSDLVRRTVEDHQSLFDEKGVALETSLAAQRLAVRGDATRLAQVVGNLLQNAVKFTPPGGRVRVATAVAAARRRATLRVADDGAGIEPAVLHRLFQPFVQAEATLDRSKGGLGLGLALVKGLVELHGGEVCAHSPGPGQGAEFVVELPLDEGAGAEPGQRGAMPAARGRRVLIVEDNVDAADSLREVLQFGAHAVAVAHSGPEGLERAREFKPEVVLCDVGLPGMDGFEVARAFRADEALKGTYLVALTGYALSEDLQRAREAGFDLHVAKPPSLESLEALLAAAPRGSS